MARLYSSIKKGRPGVPLWSFRHETEQNFRGHFIFYCGNKHIQHCVFLNHILRPKKKNRSRSFSPHTMTATHIFSYSVNGVFFILQPDRRLYSQLLTVTAPYLISYWQINKQRQIYEPDGIAEKKTVLPLPFLNILHRLNVFLVSITVADTSLSAAQIIPTWTYNIFFFP